MTSTRRDTTRTERFPRTARLRRKKDFVRVLSTGARVRGSHVVIHALTNELDTCRLGLTVSRKVGNAVVRNRVKRRLREVFRRELRAVIDDSCGPTDLVIRALPESASASHAELKDDLHRLVRRWLRRRARSGGTS